MVDADCHATLDGGMFSTIHHSKKIAASLHCYQWP